MATDEAALSDAGEDAIDDGEGSRVMADDSMEPGDMEMPSVLIRFLEDVSVEAYGVRLSSRHRFRSVSGEGSGRSLRSSSRRATFSWRSLSFSSLRRLAIF